MAGTRVLVLGALNLIVAAGAYYGTWWLADPELRVRVIMHVPLPGVDRDATAGFLVPTQRPGGAAGNPNAVSGPPLAASDRNAQTDRAAFFVGTIVGWELLATVAAFGLAASAGALLGRGGSRALHVGAWFLALVMIAALAWPIGGQWAKYQRITPDVIRYGVGGLAVLAVLGGIMLKRRTVGLTYVAAILLILSAAGSAAALYICVQYDAFEPAELPLPVLPLLCLVFVIQSLWGWILLPLTSRIRY